MLLRFNDISRDAATLDETGFLDRKGSPRVLEMVGRQPAAEAAFKKTGAKAVQSAIQGQPRALMGAIEFTGNEEDDDSFLRRMIDRWEAHFMAGYSRHDHYEILWHHLKWGVGHELRFFLPLWNKADQAPLPAPKSALDRADIWTRVQALTFGLKDPFPRQRAGIRPDFQLAERGPNRSLRSALIAHIEDAVMAGELRSRREVIADLGKSGFEVSKEDPEALTVRYTGVSEELVQKSKRPIQLAGPAFEEGFGQVADPKVLEIEEVVKEGVKRLRSEARAHSEKLEPDIGKVISDAVGREIIDALGKTDRTLEEKLTDFQSRAAALIEQKKAEIGKGAAEMQASAEVERKKLDEQLAHFQKVTRESKAALMEEVKSDLSTSVEVVKTFSAKLSAMQQQVDDQLMRKDALIKKQSYLLGAAAAVALILLMPTVYFSIGGAGLVSQVKDATAQIEEQRQEFSALGAQTSDELVQHRAALSHAVELQGQVQDALQGMAQSMSILNDAVRIEEKADGSSALTIYSRKIPTVRNCDRQPGCIARVDTRSN